MDEGRTTASVTAAQPRVTCHSPGGQPCLHLAQGLWSVIRFQHRALGADFPVSLALSLFRGPLLQPCFLSHTPSRICCFAEHPSELAIKPVWFEWSIHFKIQSKPQDRWKQRRKQEEARLEAAE